MNTCLLPLLTASQVGFLAGLLWTFGMAGPQDVIRPYRPNPGAGIDQGAVTLAGVRAEGAEESPWQVYTLHPFVEATADRLLEHLGPVADEVTLAGLRNDWVHASLAIVAIGTEPATVTVNLEGPPEIIAGLQLRVVGFIKQKDLGYVLDPILQARPDGIPANPWRCLRNFEGIRRLPTVTATPTDPVVLWITADTRRLPVGRHSGVLQVVDSVGRERRLAVGLDVGDYELPLDNPLYGYGWQWAPQGPQGGAWLRYFWEHGINVTHLPYNFDEARKAGYKFFLFVFNPSWSGKGPEEVPPEEIQKALDHVRAEVNRLHLQPDEWAIELCDEPNDQAVPKVVAWTKRLRELWPQARFWSNLPWGPGPEPINRWATVEGTFKPLAEVLDFWCPYSWNLWDQEADQHLAILRASGKPIWFYDIWGMSAARRPEVGRQMLRLGPWLAWKYRLQGFGWYALDEWSDDDPWGDQTASECYACTYPPTGGYEVPVPGRGFEAVQQGFQDYKRLHELRHLGVGEGRLDGFAERVLRAEDVQAIDRVRREMDELLLALRKE